MEIDFFMILIACAGIYYGREEDCLEMLFFCSVILVLTFLKIVVRV